MNNYDDLFNRNTDSESIQNKRTEKNIAALEDIFKNSIDEKIFEDTSNLSKASSYFSSSNDRYDYNKSSIGLSDGIQKYDSPIDPLEKTGEISNVDLETLRNYSKMLHEQMDESKEETQTSSQSSNKGKVLVKASEHFKNSSNDVGEILQAFISCSILSFITAGIGVSWLLYIIMHI